MPTKYTLPDDHNDTELMFSRQGLNCRFGPLEEPSDGPLNWKDRLMLAVGLLGSTACVVAIVAKLAGWLD